MPFMVVGWLEACEENGPVQFADSTHMGEIAHAYGLCRSRCSAPVAAAAPSDCGAGIGSTLKGRLRIAAVAGRLAMHETLP